MRTIMTTILDFVFGKEDESIELYIPLNERDSRLLRLRDIEEVLEHELGREPTPREIWNWEDTHGNAG